MSIMFGMKYPPYREFHYGGNWLYGFFLYRLSGSCMHEQIVNRKGEREKKMWFAHTKKKPCSIDIHHRKWMNHTEKLSGKRKTKTVAFLHVFLSFTLQQCSHYICICDRTIIVHPFSDTLPYMRFSPNVNVICARSGRDKRYYTTTNITHRRRKKNNGNASDVQTVNQFPCDFYYKITFWIVFDWHFNTCVVLNWKHSDILHTHTQTPA